MNAARALLLATASGLFAYVSIACVASTDDDCALEPELCGSFGGGNAQGRTTSRGATPSGSQSNASGNGTLLGGEGPNQHQTGEADGGQPPPTSSALPNISMNGVKHVDPSNPIGTSETRGPINIQNFATSTPGLLVVALGATWCGPCESFGSSIATTLAPAFATKNVEFLYTLQGGGAWSGVVSTAPELNSWISTTHANFSVGSLDEATQATMYSAVSTAVPQVVIYRTDTGASVYQGGHGPVTQAKIQQLLDAAAVN